MVLTFQTPPLAQPLRILLNGGDNMLGRAIQLTLPHQSPGEGAIKDAMTSWQYLNVRVPFGSQPESDGSRV